MSRRCHGRVITAEQSHAENMARIPQMTKGEQRQRIKLLKANLTHARNAQHYSLSGGVQRKYQRRLGLADAKRMQQGYLISKRFMEIELRQLEQLQQQESK